MLHLSGHGASGSIELADEDGQAIRVGAEELTGAFQEIGRTVPLLFLSSCDSGGEVASLAVALHRRGLERVVAMQAPVSDGYATELAAAFYRQLSIAPFPRAGVALAIARREVQHTASASAAGSSAPSGRPPPCSWPAMTVR